MTVGIGSAKRNRLAPPVLSALLVLIGLELLVLTAMSMSRRDAATALQVIEAGGHRVALGLSVDGELPLVAEIPVRSEHWSQAALEKAFGAPVSAVELPSGWEGRDRPFMVGGSIPGEIQVDLSTGAAPGFFFSSVRDPYSDAGRSTRSITASEAVEMAEDFVESHGGLPEDAFVYEVRGVEEVSLDLGASDDEELRSTEATRALGFYVVYKHAVEGILIDSPGGGDNIRVRVDGDGVIFYNRNWREPLSPQAAMHGKPLSAREALERALDDSAHDDLVKADLGPELLLQDARLVYVSGFRTERVRTLRPAWRFDFGRGQPVVYADARTGRVLKRTDTP